MKTQNSPAKANPSLTEKLKTFDFCVLRFYFVRKRTGFTPLENPSSSLPISSSLHLRRHRRREVSNSLTGFTMVEMIIILAILIMIIGIVLVNFPTISQRANIKHASQGLATSLRKVQNMAFAVRQVNTVNCGLIVPAYYGVYLNTAVDSGSYIVFADLPFNLTTCQAVQADGLYRNRVNDFVIDTVKLDPGISLERLESLSKNNEGVLNITFSVPEARTKISNDSSSIGEYAEIFLTARDPNSKRSIFIRTSGQIYTR